MIGEREWIARCCSLAQTEHDILRQLQNSFNRCADSLTREERDTLLSFTDVFSPTDRSYVQQFHSENVEITNIRPHERGFKVRLDRLEKDIIALRVSSAAEMEKANGDIRKANDDIDRREKRIVDLQTPAIRPKQQIDIEFDSPVSEFQTYLSRNGGRTGGWDTESHTEFLRQYQRHGEKDLPSHLPNIPEDSVLAHIEWYQKFIELKQKMKSAMNEMRENNRKARQVVEIEDEKAPKVDPELVKLRLAERERVKQLKAQKAEEAEREAKKADNDFKKKQFAKLKTELMRKSARKPSPIEEVDPVKEKEKADLRKQKFKTDDWERIRKRDAAVEERKNAIKQQQDQMRIAREEKEMKLAEANAKKFRHAKRDPERLMKPTSAVLARKNAENNEPKGPVNSVFAIPHRAVPAWMA